MQTQVMFPTLDRPAVLMLLHDEAMHQVGRRKPGDLDGPDVHAAFATTVRHTMRTVSHTIHRGGLYELRKYYRHAAFRDQPALREWIAKAYAVCKKSGDTRALIYVVLLLRDQVRHYYEFSGEPPKEERLPLPSAREAERPMQREWRKTDTGEYEDYLVRGAEVEPSDGVARGALDLMGWDRPTSFPTKTMRMAFCGTCADLGQGSPWFRVKRRVTADGYERPPYAMTATCPTCGQLEVPPRPPTSTRIYIHAQTVRYHGKKVQRTTLFYRTNGYWHWANHTRCHAELHYAIEQRWKRTPRRK